MGEFASLRALDVDVIAEMLAVVADLLLGEVLWEWNVERAMVLRPGNEHLPVGGSDEAPAAQGVLKMELDRRHNPVLVLLLG